MKCVFYNIFSTYQARPLWEGQILPLLRHSDVLGVKVVLGYVNVHAGLYRFLNAPLADIYPMILWYITAQWSISASAPLRDNVGADASVTVRN